MKNRTLLLLSSISLLFVASCSSNSSTKTAQDSLAPVSQAGSDNRTGADTMGANAGSTPSATDHPKGKDMISKLDCIACHKENEKLVGPSYADVAKKYTEKDIDYLAGKIISGGSGVWGAAAMTPHPALSKDDATEIVKYILSVK